MGFNTVAFLLNDHMGELERSPKTVTWALTHPPHSKADLDSWWEQVDSAAVDAGEPRLHRQALEVLPTFHADGQVFYLAGGNRIDRLKTLSFGKDKDGKPTVTLALPKWWHR